MSDSMGESPSRPGTAKLALSLQGRGVGWGEAGVSGVGPEWGVERAGRVCPYCH